jgi:hypothetical protein
MPEIEKAILSDRIFAAEKEMATLPQIVIEPKHYFVPGAYIREITIPAGTMLTSKTHRTEHVSIMLTGDMSVVTPDGVRRITAPHMDIGAAGSKRMGFAHEDSRWITIHATNQTDLDKIEAEQFIEDNISMFDFSTGQVLPEKQIELDRIDYRRMLAQSGFSHETVRLQTEEPVDRMDIDLNPCSVEIRPSSIEGDGVFAVRDLSGGATIGAARLGGKRTQLGRYTNHSCRPNAIMVRDDRGDIWLTSAKKISEGEEITIDYRQALSLSRKPKEDLCPA